MYGRVFSFLLLPCGMEQQLLLFFFSDAVLFFSGILTSLVEDY
jgi:hypothetical protein